MSEPTYERPMVLRLGNLTIPADATNASACAHLYVDSLGRYVLTVQTLIDNLPMSASTLVWETSE